VRITSASERLQELTALETHAGRHREYAAVATPSAHQARPSRYCRSSFYHHAPAGAGVLPSCSARDHGQADAVLDGPAGIHGLQLAEDAGARRVAAEAPHFYERRIGDQFEHVAVDVRVLRKWRKGFSQMT